MKTPVSVAILVAILAMTNHFLLRPVFSAPVRIKGNAQAILPGRSVGNVVIGAPLPVKIGPPATGDAAMGLFENTYIGKMAPHYHLDILTRRLDKKNDPIVVKTIRIESPYFHTANGLNSHSRMSAIRRQYPHLVPVEYWENVSYHPSKRYTIFDDRKQGIAFEIAKDDSRAIAIFIHAAGQPLEVIGHDDKVWRSTPIPRGPDQR